MRTLLCLGFAVVAIASARAQGETFQRLALRVTANGGRPTEVLVDRGSRDRVESGDIVHLFPRRGGRMLRGRVLRVDARSALVEMIDASDTKAPPPGTRGEVLVPASAAEAEGEAVPDSDAGTARTVESAIRPRTTEDRSTAVSLAAERSLDSGPATPRRSRARPPRSSAAPRVRPPVQHR